MNAYSDTIYTRNGKYYTGEHLKNDYMIDDANAAGFVPLTWEQRDAIKGEKIACNYNQLFWNDSALVLCNNLPERFPEIWDGLENGDIFDDDDEPAEIFQWYIVDDSTARALMDHTGELVFYVDALDVYALAVTHYGTAWSHVPAEFIY